MADIGRREYLRTHTLQGEHLQIDLAEAAQELKAMLGEQDRRGVTLVRQSGLSVVLLHMRSGTSLDEHAAPGPAIVSILDGHVEVILNDESFDAPKGRMVAFDAAVRHSVRALEDSTLMLTIGAEPPQEVER